MKIFLAVLALLASAMGQAASDNIVVVGNQAQPVQWIHQPSIQLAILKAGPTGTVWIPGNYTGNDCNPISSCSPGTTLVIDLRGGLFQTTPSSGGGANFPLAAPNGSLGNSPYGFANSAGGAGLYLNVTSTNSLVVSMGLGFGQGFGCGNNFLGGSTGWYSGLLGSSDCGYFGGVNSFRIQGQNVGNDDLLMVGFNTVTIAGNLDQDETARFGGSCTMSSNTSCSFNLVHNYNTPICIVTPQGSTPIAASCAITGSGTQHVTITAASSNSLIWGALIFGNPN